MSGQIESFGGHQSRKKRNFKVFIHKGEWRQIEEWVLMKDNIETGGDLFGLWIDQHTAVVQFVLGPGQHCKRTTDSFYQDVNYLEKAGKYLTERHGLCNIGQWHSHHRINLPRPSGGDENTVWGNMPNLGLDRYIVFIATIQDVSHKPTAGVNCFLFEIKNGDRLPVLKGTLEQVQGNTNSPFRLNKNIGECTKDGAESVNSAKIIPKREESQEILKTGQFQNSSSRETESKFVLVGTKDEDHGNKITTPTSGDRSQMTNIKEGQQVSKQSRENENRKDIDEKQKKEMAKTNQNKPKHNTKVSPTHMNEGNPQFYSSKNNNDQTEKRTPVPQENHEPVVLREEEDRVEDTQTSSEQVPSFNNGVNASAPHSNYPSATNSNTVICQQPRSSNRSQNNPNTGSCYDNLGGPSTNTAHTGNPHDTPSGTLTNPGNIPDREVDEKNDNSKCEESDENKRGTKRCFCCFS